MFDMKILCAFYICLMFTLEGARLTPAPWQQQQQQQQHLSRKLNRESPLEPAGEEHHHQPAADDLYSRRRQSPARCLRRVDKLPDHVEHAAEQHNQPPPSLRKLSSVDWRWKREARHFLPARFHPGRDRRKVIIPRRSGLGRRGHRPRYRRRKRKRKRSQPGEIDVTHPNASVPVEPQQVVTSTGPALITAAAPNVVAQTHVNSGKGSDTSSGHIIFAVVSCLLALLVSGVLLFYLYSKSRRKSGFDPFYCPPEIGDSHREYNPSDIERCTCCSSERRGALSSSAGRSQEQKKKQRATRPVKKVQPKKTTTTTTKKKKSSSTMARKQPPAKQPPPFSETELREIQSRIACILRRDCGRCNCCRCNAVDDEEEPRRSNKFKLFRMKKNKPAATALCNDARCDENKIRCLVNLCRASDTAGLRIKQ